MNIYEFMSGSPWLTFFLVWIFCGMVGNTSYAIAKLFVKK